ncbi:MAG: Eco57I restriction-modification methylase domain-containing protein [Verrucomicrobiia bacterium]
MPLDFQRARPLLQSCALPKLFVEELGWEPARQKLTLSAGEADYAFTAVAEKRGFTAWLCESSHGGLPDHVTRLKLDRKLSETSFEHLIVFVTGDHSSQSWMWVRREQGKPLSARTHDYHRGQPGDSLLQKLQILYVSLEEEEAGLSTVAVAGRARAAFDIERVTKAFYRDFDTHRKAFLKFIDGIGEVANREWYASVMLNRLMFVYFIQRKGFLDGDHNYLRNRLDRCKMERGKDRFYSFYRYFLLRLFHEGFGKRRKDRAPDLEKLLGSIPYLNGGLFAVHELEKPECYGKDIQIPDKAFERVFDYFDQYQWHLDERPLRKDDEINPDVLGYIFEKYINQKQMGAYYTKEDITEYISKNTVLPFLFDAARAKCKVAFENPHGPTVWDLLRENPDRYIYPAVRHGTDRKLSPEIAAGLDATKPNLIERRQPWNKPAPADYALPTEIWREVVARRQRYEEVRRKLAAGDVREVNDFITLNLDLRQFAQDVIQNCEGPDLLMAFWQAITTITVLDPTGGSGAFIFAALNILEPLYEACLDRMEAFLAEWGEAGKRLHPNYHKKFTEVLARVDAHPNRRYFVLKSIILNNLYAVDIMEEAVEICKLRLFLKLAAQVEPDASKDNLGIEPLPDIDFNIRAGNTLVGYATAEEVRRCMKELGGGQMKLMDEEELGSFARFNTRCADVEDAFAKFRQLQTEGDGSVPAADKLELQNRLKALEDELNRHLAGEYGVKVSDKAAYAKWVKSHQPFHWFIQFYGILKGGGFDVIIGNPPYLEIREVDYAPKNYTCLDSGAIHAMCIERSEHLLHKTGCMSMIVPLSLPSTQRMEVVQKLLEADRNAWYADYAWRPAKLFDTVNRALTIFVVTPSGDGHTFSTNYQKWTSDDRDGLFERLNYVQVLRERPACWIPKLGDSLEQHILNKCLAVKTAVKHFTGKSDHRVYYRTTGGLYWKVFTDFAPAFNLNGRKGHSSRETWFTLGKKEHVRPVIAALSSNVFWWWYTVTSNVRDLNPFDIQNFLLPASALADPALHALGARYLKDLDKNSTMLVREQKQTGTTETQSFKIQKSKPIIDEIDTVLAGHYGFTAEELDFIINYDIKYRLGRDTETEGE